MCLSSCCHLVPFLLVLFSCLPNNMVVFFSLFPLVILCPWSSCYFVFLLPTSFVLWANGSWGLSVFKGWLFFPACSPGHLVPSFLVNSSCSPGNVFISSCSPWWSCAWSSCSSVSLFPGSFVLSAREGCLGVGCVEGGVLGIGGLKANAGD